ncbi:Protein of unknown function (DUF2589) [Halovivax ruber XH-70]|uniref:DUF2589 domain-containing protein n=1 Tax=Halovivax ruber (strain DSM 18193 / JCM 13892 / XH-70) TaxID=797302 RepID=L0IF40_HALRX|nr:DUF2589 domain-containing protein [Halovivax ruber]AGB16597.1 Protein of unknown function (DUF2589) [Halovivax ruber XH-70]
MTDELQNLPLSSLFSGPLIAAIDASVEAQTESVALLREYGYDEDGQLVTVTFGYTTIESDPAGGTRRVAREIEIPLLLFLSLPNLVIHQIEEEFSAKITEVETVENEPAAASPAMVPYRPPRLRVTPSDRETTMDRKTRSTYDLNVRMVAELQNQSAGMDVLDRVTQTATSDRVDEERTAALSATEGHPDGGGPAIAPGTDDGRRADLSVPDPSAFTVSELQSAIDDIDDGATLRAMLTAERENHDRKTARQAIERRLDDVRGGEDSVE